MKNLRKRTKTTKGIVNTNKSERTKSSDSFICSECNSAFDTFDQANHHILTDHYGLARINSKDKTPFKPSEVIKAYNSAIKILSVLVCKKCDKQFRSGLGLKSHEDICGKSEQERNVNCEICNKTLKLSSIKSHVRTHLQRVPTSVNDSLSTSEDPMASASTTDTASNRPVRRSARRAMQKFVQSSSDSEEEKELQEANKRRKLNTTTKSGGDPNKRLSKSTKVSADCEDNSFSEELSSDDSDSDLNNVTKDQDDQHLIYYDYAQEKQTIQNASDADQVVCELFTKFSSHLECVYSEKRTWPVPSKLKSSDIDKYQYFGYWRCPATCGSLFEDVESAKAHYTHCGLVARQKCKYCSMIYDTKTEFLQHLFDQHIQKLPQIVVKPSKTNVSCKKLPNRVNRVPTSSNNTAQEYLHFCDKYFSQKKFQQFMPDAKHFKLIQNDEFELFFRENNKSPSFRFVNRNQDNDSQTTTSDWHELNLFEYNINQNHINIFTGGPVYSGAWCPFDNDNEQYQMLCISTASVDPNKEFKPEHENSYLGILQFWKIEGMHKGSKVKDCKATLAFAIGHDFGVIWDMKWCPGATTYVNIPDANSKWSRLGLLSLACSDGKIRILSIPFCQQIRSHFNILDDSRCGPLIRCQPSIVLVDPPKCPSLLDKNVICKCLSWSETDDQRWMAAGYGNGLISIFDLNSQSSLLISHGNADQPTQIMPLKSWIAHGAVVNSLTWLPYSGCEYIISGSFDRNVKLWDLKDLSSSINLQKRGIVTKVDYCVQWCGVFFSHDDCYMNLRNHIMFKGLTPEAYANSLSKHKGCVWDFNMSRWLNAEASVDFSGESVIHLYFTPNGRNKARRKKKFADFSFLPLYRIECDLLNTDKENDEFENASEDKNYLINREYPAMPNKKDFASMFGLSFIDVDLSDIATLPQDEISRINNSDNMNYARLCDFPMVSLNKVEWNPNKNVCNWLFTSGESGITRISCVPLLSTGNFNLDQIE